MPQLKNRRQEDFCLEYVKDPNPVRALRAAGYTPKSENTAASTASQLLKSPKVASRIAELTAKIEAKIIFDKVRILDELGRIALSDTRKLFDEEGKLKKPHEWPDDLAHAVAGIEVEELWKPNEDGPGKYHAGYVTKVKLWDKNAALTNLAKHFKILFNGPAVGVNVGEGATLNLQVNMAGDTAKQRLLKLVGPGAYSNGHTNGSAEPGGAPGAQAVA